MRLRVQQEGIGGGDASQTAMCSRRRLEWVCPNRPGLLPVLFLNAAICGSFVGFPYKKVGNEE